jgi:glutaconate CoA-transferase subunit B
MSQSNSGIVDFSAQEQTEGYSLASLIAVDASHLLEDGRSVFVGTGLPMIAALLAQRTHAPNLLIVFEAGGVGPHPPCLPISVGDSRTFHLAVLASSMHDVMSAACAGYIDFGFLGGSAIDQYGNVNTTIIGEWDHPTVRLPGSGGANDVGSFCWRTIYIMRKQSPRTFVQKLPFITTPGYLDGPGGRERAGLPSGCGPFRVITQLGVFAFDETKKCITLIARHPGVSVDEILANSEFEIPLAPQILETKLPTAEELRILQEIDPTGMVIGK